MTTVCGPVRMLLAMDGVLMCFQVGRTPVGDLAGGLALLDTRLFIAATVLML